MNTLRLLATAALGASLTTLTYTIANHPGEQRDAATAGNDMVVTAEVITAAAPEPPAEVARWVSHTIASGDTLGELLPRFSVSSRAIQDATQELYDLSKIRIGRTLSFRIEPGEAVPVELRYPLDEDRTLVVHRDGEDWSAFVDEIAYTVSEGQRALTVTSSLWKAAVDGGLRPRDIASMAKVLESDLDFNTEIRAGATARMIVEELYDESGEFARLGAPLALIFDNAGHEYVAIRFTSDDGVTRYYDADGTSRKRAFLRSPLEFSRVTSGFNPRRFHPVLKKPRPHNGTDFGAPTGTPVRAVADATVSRAGRAGGHGNFIKLDHAGPYESSYSHLSRIAVAKGERIKQGQIIGYVGSTGMSTGPHLHYQFWVNGRYVDPMSIELPRGQRLSDAELARFSTTRDDLLARLGSEPTPSTEQTSPGDALADAAEQQ
ncbi:MAG: murein DD-endopeptidase MepM/ murein hydrolase activator NlpD [Myxococcota bacterium]|jgi:murein DD-endopeptidase MepM/ murein hydrolase activator NlpD